MANSTVIVENLTKRFGDFVAVNDLSFEVGEGELLCLLGPSGCGKTTLLRMLAGLLEPTSGEIYLGGKCVYSSSKGIFVPPAKRGLGMMFQNYALWPHMSVRENIAYGLKTQRVAKAEAAKRLDDAAKMMGISDLLERFPTELSGGQQQRVALARMVVVQPALFLMDEPLSNLDARLRVHTRVELRRIQQEMNISGVYVTHDQEEALALADNIAVMNQGDILHLGTPVDVYENSQHIFVASFLGSPPPNEIEGRLESDGARSELQLPHFGALDIGAGSVKAGSIPVTVTVRPEYCELRRAGDSVPPGTAGADGPDRAVSEPLTVISSQFMGTHYVVIVEGEAGGQLYLRREKSEPLLPDGSLVQLTFELRRLGVYSKASGRPIS